MQYFYVKKVTFLFSFANVSCSRDVSTCMKSINP